MKALVVDDHPVFVSALKTVLKQLRRGVDVDTATSAEEALQQIEYHPDYQFILLDLTMPGLDGFAFLRALEQRKLNIPAIIVSSDEEPETIHACIKAGAVGFIPKSYDSERMMRAVEQVMNGEIYLPEALVQSSVQTDGDAIKQRCEQIGITDKTYQVLEWLAKGKTNKEIAEEMYISVHTVKAHLARLFERLQTSNRMDAVMESIRLGLIDG